MDPTYEAILTDDRIQWTGESPSDHSKGQSLHIQVTILGEIPVLADRNQGQRMTDALGALAEMNAFSSVSDPLQWERDIRRDRSLPGREKR